MQGTVRGVTITPRRVRGPREYVALGIATCGVGYIPIAPGTWGSALGVAVYLLFRSLCFHYFPAPAPIGRTTELELYVHFTVLLFLIGLTLIGIWAASQAETLLGRKDPRRVVIDEVVGQLITFLSVPLTIKPWTIFVGFLTFRAFDIWKPYPIRRLEALESGLGIMADDVIAGTYSAVVLSAIFAVATAV